MLPDERWKVIPERPNYMVSNQGRVCNKHGRILKDRFMSGRNRDYRSVTLYRNGIPKHFKIARLVAIAFVSNPLQLTEVNHINEIKTDDRYMNLEWITHRENILNSSWKWSGFNNGNYIDGRCCGASD